MVRGKKTLTIAICMLQSYYKLKGWLCMAKENHELQFAPFGELSDAKLLKEQFEEGKKIMDALQGLGIKEVTFKNGAYFRNGRNDRALAWKGGMIAETATDLYLRVPKESATAEEIIRAKSFEPTQKMTAAYTGTSQSRVSGLKNGKA